MHPSIKTSPSSSQLKEVVFTFFANFWKTLYFQGIAEPRFNESLYNEVVFIMNDILHPGLLKYTEQNLDITNQFPQSLGRLH